MTPPTVDANGHGPMRMTLPAASDAGGQNAVHMTLLPIGTRLGEFEITEVIGEGGFGIVYLAHDDQLQREVAIKEYMPSGLATRMHNGSIAVRAAQHAETFEDGRRSFINEARLLAQFDHPSLVKVHRFWESNGTAYMVMPYYRGSTLRSVVKAMPDAPDEAWLKRLLLPLLEALQTIHSVHCYHRDIAPDNILILENERPVLLDFGAARRVIGEVTHALTAILKPGYAPIEQYANGPEMKQGPWTDLYALAAVVHYCVARSAPPASISRMMSDTLPPMAKLSGGRYSAGFCAAIDHGLKLHAEQRTQSAQQFRDELLGAAGSSVPAAAASSSRGDLDFDQSDRTIVIPRPRLDAGPPSRADSAFEGLTQFGSGQLPPAAAPHDPWADLPGAGGSPERAASVHAAAESRAATPTADPLGLGVTGSDPSSLADLLGPAVGAEAVAAADPLRESASLSKPTRDAKAAAVPPAEPVAERNKGSSRAWLGIGGFVLVLGAAFLAAWLLFDRTPPTASSAKSLPSVSPGAATSSSSSTSAPSGSLPALTSPASSSLGSSAASPGGSAPAIDPSIASQPGIGQGDPAMAIASAPGTASQLSSTFSLNSLFDALYAGRDPQWVVDAQLATPSMRINVDRLRFTVRSARAGFVYVLSAGSDGEHLVQLFPNATDRNNRLAADKPLRLPRDVMPLGAGGPPGVNAFIVLVTPSPRDFSAAGAKPSPPFVEYDLGNTRSLYESSGVGPFAGTPTGCQGDAEDCKRYGAARFNVEERR